MNVLDKIVQHKLKEVSKQKEITTIQQLESSNFFERAVPSFAYYLEHKDKSGIIAEFKRKSPSKGIINNKASINEVVTAYQEHGASAVSILTDQVFFGGSKDDVVCNAHLTIPILRKDFIVDEYQVIETKAIGAAVILLIAACLTKKQVQQFATLAKSVGLQVLLEVHQEKELDFICDAVTAVGVNNRNLQNFEVDIHTSFQLIHKIPASFIPVTESGINNVNTILSLQEVGYKGFLIGEFFMHQPDPNIAFANFIQQLNALKK
jgi:indole-3-glycerol phosphate synthase